MPAAAKLDRNSTIPIHRQVEGWLRGEIEAGKYKPEELIPSTKKLREMLGGINHLTVRHAISTLVHENILTPVRGRGVYVTPTKIRLPRIGLALPNLDDEFTREIAHGVQEILDEIDPTTQQPRAVEIVFDSRSNAQKEIDRISNLDAWSLDGLILHPVGYRDLTEHLVKLKLKKFPFVLVDWVSQEVKFHSVSADNRKGGYAVTKHLLDTGRKNLAWIGNTKNYSSALLRKQGFLDALNDHHIPHQKEIALELGIEDGEEVPARPLIENFISSLLKKHYTVDGIVCANDLEALICLDYLKRKRIKIPQKIAVTGFDNSARSQESIPPLTTVFQPAREMGRQAARLLLDQIKTPWLPEKQVSLPVELIIRASSFSKSKNKHTHELLRITR